MENIGKLYKYKSEEMLNLWKDVSNLERESFLRLTEEIDRFLGWRRINQDLDRVPNTVRLCRVAACTLPPTHCDMLAQCQDRQFDMCLNLT